MPDKLRAVEQLAKLCGFNEPEKMEVELWYKAQQQELIAVIGQLRGRGAQINAKTRRVPDNPRYAAGGLPAPPRQAELYFPASDCFEHLTLDVGIHDRRSEKDGLKMEDLISSSVKAKKLK